MLEEGDFARTEGMLKAFCAGRERDLKAGVGKAAPLEELADSYESGLTALESLRGSQENYAVYDLSLIHI